MIASITEYINILWEGAEWEGIIMWLCILYVVLHRPWRSDFVAVAPLPRSDWKPKVSKHPLLEIDREIQETEMLEQMWREK